MPQTSRRQSGSRPAGARGIHNEPINTSSENGNSHRPAVDVLNENPHSNSASTIQASLLAPPKQLDETKPKSRKRKLIICALFRPPRGQRLRLYRLLKVNRVNVSVQANTRHDAQSAKTKEDSKGPDNNSSVEAIRLARQALGSDSPTTNCSASRRHS